jgi:acyl phosphate:glycerol-3-phosphate acyltransferase
MTGMIGIFAVPALAVMAIAYLLGSISFSIIFTRMFDNHVDIRTMGSGNAGLTNVLRSVGAKAAACTLVCDFAKGGASVCIGKAIFQYVCTVHGVPVYAAQYGAYLAGLACILGHIYPIYFNFRGGKGILSTSAMLAFVDWRLFLAALSVFAVVLAISKIVSLSSICGALSFPVFNFLFSYFIDYRMGQSVYGAIPISYVWATTALSAVTAAILVMKHRSNICRLKNGTEKKFSVKH